MSADDERLREILKAWAVTSGYRGLYSLLTESNLIEHRLKEGRASWMRRLDETKRKYAEEMKEDKRNEKLVAIYEARIEECQWVLSHIALELIPKPTTGRQQGEPA